MGSPVRIACVRSNLSVTSAFAWSLRHFQRPLRRLEYLLLPMMKNEPFSLPRISEPWITWGPIYLFADGESARWSRVLWFWPAAEMSEACSFFRAFLAPISHPLVRRGNNKSSVECAHAKARGADDRNSERAPGRRERWYWARGWVDQLRCVIFRSLTHAG